MRKLIFVVLTAVLAACGPGEMGERGPAGPTGPAGPKGDAGAPGIGLTTRRVCVGTHPIGNNQQPVVLIYLRYDFADGSAFVTCSAQRRPSTDEREDSIPFFYPAGDDDIGGCSVEYDADDGFGSGFGLFVFDVAKGAALGQALYGDEGSAFNGTIISLNCSDIN